MNRNSAIKEQGKDLYWYDASKLTIEGKGWAKTESFYDRLPAKAREIVRTPVWLLSKHSSGITVHFSTNSPSLSVRWDGFSAMGHMPASGVSGLDLYVRHENKWRWLATAVPSGAFNETQPFADLPEKSRDYMLYLPLYNTVHRIELGIPGKFEMRASPVRTKKPVVFYGTSITQGGCASRPGMCYAAILGRRLDNPVINLGFSGNGSMDPEVIDLLCELDPAVYVLDNLPNMEEKLINERAESAVRELRAARPGAHVVLVDTMFYCDAFLKKNRMDRCISSNRAQYAVYRKLVKEGLKNLHYIKDNGLIGTDGEATVDGTHFSDLGYMRFSEKLFPLLKQLVTGFDVKKK